MCLPSNWNYMKNKILTTILVDIIYILLVGFVGFYFSLAYLC